MKILPDHEHGCPISRSFFARCGSNECRLELLIGCWEFRGESSGIPHLAKNERDVGHPFSWRGES